MFNMKYTNADGKGQEPLPTVCFMLALRLKGFIYSNRTVSILGLGSYSYVTSS